MGLNVAVLTLVLISLKISTLRGEKICEIPFSKHDCPTWMYRVNNTGYCVCQRQLDNIVLCNNETRSVRVLDGYIMTYNDATNQEEVGKTLYGWRKKKFSGTDNHIYYHVSCNRLKLNEICNRFNRRGRLCGQCKDGYSPLVYSYEPYCVNCSKTGSINAVKFAVAAFGPLTLFYSIVVLFKLDANSPSLHCYIFLAQTLASSSGTTFFFTRYNNNVWLSLISAFFGVWNLDFFRTFYANICLNIGSLNAVSLEYAVAFYPLFLILVTFTAAEMHYRGFRFVVWVWNPFQRFFQRYRSQWNIRSSLVDVIATFILLTYNKILGTSFALLRYTRPLNYKAESVGTYLYYDATIEYLGEHHRPYGAMAILFFVIFNILPILLLFFYPMRWFQWCLNHFKLSHICLHTFVDSFTGCYKDGTKPGTRDCRYFAALFLFLRILYYVILILCYRDYFVTCGFLWTIFIILFIVNQPYKQKYSAYNIISPTLLVVVLALMLTVAQKFDGGVFTHHTIITEVIFIILIAIPTFYFIALIIRWIWIHSPFKKQCCKYMKKTSETSLTTATLFKAAESRTKLTRNYGATDTKS